MIRRGMIVYLFLIHMQLIANDKQQFLFDHLNTTHGLSSDNVFSIIQDSSGFIWIATSDGLNKYDGYNFRQFKSNPSDSTSLINNSLENKNALFIDSQKRLWIGTANGISRYLPTSNNFKNYIPDKTKINDPGYNTITGICEDTNGTLYFSTAWGLIFSLKDNENKLNLIHQNRLGSNITDLIIDNHQLWVAGSQAGLFRFNLETSALVHYETSKIFKSELIVSINDLYKKDSLLYLITNNSGIYSCNLQTLTFNIEISNLESPLTIKEINNDLWIGANDGIYIKSKSSEIIKIPTNSTNPYGLHSDAKTIYQDNQGNIWVGGTMGGVHLLKHHYGFKKYIPNENSNLNLSTEKVSSFYQDEKGQLWVGYFSGEIDRFSLKLKKRYANYPKENITKAEGNGTIFKFFKDDQSRLWACTSNKGIKVYTSGQFKRLGLKVKNNNLPIHTNDIRSVCQDPEGAFWLSIHGNGLCKYDIERGEQVYFFSDSGAVDHTISNIYGNDLLYDENGYIWFSTSYGLNRIDYKSLKVRQYFYDELNPTSIAGNFSSTMFLDSHGRLWISTNRGLSIYNKEQDNFLTVNEKNGLKDADIRGITEDSNGTIWVTSRMDISSIYIPSNLNNLNDNLISIENFELSAFSGYNEFFPGAILYKQGTIFIGGSKGIFTFDPNNNLNQTIKIPIYITDLQVFNESLDIGNNGIVHTFEKHVSLADTIILRHDQNMLTFEFVGLYYVSPGEIEYAYMLEGLENKWNFTSEKTKVTYGNLTPQQYTFKIRASVLNQNREQNERSLVVIIKKPYWQKTWFKLTAAAFIILLLYILFIIRINILKKQKRKLEEKVVSRTADLKEANDLLSQKNDEIINQKDEIERIALELHEADQVKIRFFMNISHEFRTPLTLILGPLEILKESLKNININYNQLNLIERNAKRLQRLVNQLLDLRKLETNTMKLKVSESNIKNFIQEIFRYFEHVAQRHLINYRFEVKDHDYNCYFDNDILEKVMYNILSNAFKYVNDGGTICLTLDKVQLPQNKMQIPENCAGDFIKITVKDNGVGIDEDKINLIFDRFYMAGEPVGKTQKGTGIGLSLTKELIHLHKGEISVTSKKNEGSVFSIIFPVSKCQFALNEITQVSNSSDIESYPIYANEIQLVSAEEISYRTDEEELILIVDDNSDIRNYLHDCLKEKFKVIEAEDGQSGLEQAKMYIPDLIISDIMMPVADGFDLTNRIKQDFTLSHVPVILLTARSGKEDELEGLNTGADDYITKPFYKEVLLARINTLLKNRQLVRDKINKELVANQDTISLEDKFLNKVIEVCEDNLQDCEFNVEQLCEKMHVSQPQLYRKIKNLTGYSPIEFMRVLRLKKAAGMIINHADNISQIAYSVGFSDPKYFSKCFKSLFGQTPTKFKNYKNNSLS